jgi:hypothetical protein
MSSNFSGADGAFFRVRDGGDIYWNRHRRTRLLTDDGKMMAILYSSVDKVLPHAGEKVTFTGNVEPARGGGILIVETIEKAK